MVLLRTQDYRLTTAEILYHLPDHPGLLQTYVWQDIDAVPLYPGLRKFLEFWTSNLDGKLHSIRVAHGSPIRRGSIRNAKHLQYLN